MNRTEENKVQRVKKEILEGKRTDLLILITTICLCGYGLVMVCSASYYDCSMSEDCGYDPLYLMKR